MKNIEEYKEKNNKNWILTKSTETDLLFKHFSCFVNIETIFLIFKNLFHFYFNKNF